MGGGGGQTPKKIQAPVLHINDEFNTIIHFTEIKVTF